MKLTIDIDLQIAEIEDVEQVLRGYFASHPSKRGILLKGIKLTEEPKPLPKVVDIEIHDEPKTDPNQEKSLLNKFIEKISQPTQKDEEAG